MKVSVIVPVWNVEKYIEQCLKSLVNQTLEEIEIIVVNDGSPDNSQTIIDKYVKKYPKKVKSFVKENGGQGSARNLGLEQAKGEYISFVDSDDWLELTALEKMYELGKKENADIVICDMVDHYANGSEKRYNCTNYDFIYETTPSACNKIFKRNIIKNIQFLNKLWYEDFNFTTKILLNNPKIATISEGYYHCNCREESTMNNNNSLKNLDMLIIMNDLIEYSKTNHIYDENVFSFLIFHHILITSINRVARHSGREKKEVIEKFIKYCQTHIKDYKKMPFYVNIPKNRKIIAKLNYNGHYCLSKWILHWSSKLKK